jgi:hypothetical protein
MLAVQWGAWRALRVISAAILQRATPTHSSQVSPLSSSVALADTAAGDVSWNLFPCSKRIWVRRSEQTPITPIAWRLWSDRSWIRRVSALRGAWAIPWATNCQPCLSPSARPIRYSPLLPKIAIARSFPTSVTGRPAPEAILGEDNRFSGCFSPGLATDLWCNVFQELAVDAGFVRDRPFLGK